MTAVASHVAWLIVACDASYHQSSASGRHGRLTPILQTNATNAKCTRTASHAHRSCIFASELLDDSTT